jgi:hypothetical protein
MKKLSILIMLFAISLVVCNAQLKFKFRDSGQKPGTGGYAYSVGDLNNDGYPDVYINTGFQNGGNPGQVWINNGKGNFTASQTIGHINITHHDAFADLNNDGFLDMFVANDASYFGNSDSVGYPNDVWLNDGTGKLIDSGQRLGRKPSGGIALGDIDGNGTIDAVVANYHTGKAPYKNFQPNEIWLNDGKGNFTISAQNLGLGGAGSPQLADIDSDGDLDILLTTYFPSDALTIWFNDGKGNFTKGTQIFANVTSIKLADVNGDGCKDIILNRVINDAGTPNEIWINDGKGTFTDNGQRIDKGIIYIGDVDADGDEDIYTTNTDSTWLWINQGGNQSGTAGTYVQTGDPIPWVKRDMILCDLDKDGDLDGISIKWNGDNKVYINDAISTDIKQVKSKTAGISIYPNPTSGLVAISFDAVPVFEINVEIYNLRGTLLSSKTFLNTTTVTIDITGFPDGMYFIKAITDRGSYEEKIIKE